MNAPATSHEATKQALPELLRGCYSSKLSYGIKLNRDNCIWIIARHDMHNRFTGCFLGSRWSAPGQAVMQPPQVMGLLQATCVTGCLPDTGAVYLFVSFYITSLSLFVLFVGLYVSLLSSQSACLSVHWALCMSFLSAPSVCPSVCLVCLPGCLSFHTLSHYFSLSFFPLFTFIPHVLQSCTARNKNFRPSCTAMTAAWTHNTTAR